MKRVGYIYEKMENKDLIRNVIIKGARGKSKRWDVKLVLTDVDKYVDKVYGLVVNRSYVPTVPRRRKIKDASSGKERIISVVPYYPDGIMHQLAAEVLKPVFMRGMYHWSCASIPKRGNMHAIRYMKRAIRNRKGTKYAAKLDIHHYYQSINLDSLIVKLGRKIKDPKMLKLVGDIVRSDGEEGLSIGFYINQWLANFYLEDIDHFIIGLDGVKYYVRNMDDMVLLGPNKRKLHRAVKAIEERLEAQGLYLNGSKQVFKLDSRGLDFVGYRFFHSHIVLRKRNLLKLIRQSRKLQAKKVITYHDAAGFISRAGQLKHCDGFSLLHRYVTPIGMRRLKRIVRAGTRAMCGSVVLVDRYADYCDRPPGQSGAREANK